MSRRRNTPGKGPVRPNKQPNMRKKAKALGYQPSNTQVKSWAKEQGWSKPVQMGGVPIPEAPNYNVNKAAKNQVALAQQGLLDEIAAQQNATWDQYQEADRGAQSIGQGAMNMFSKPQALQRNFAQAGQAFNQNLQGMPDMGDMQGSAGPAASLAAENQAQAALGDQLGSNTHAALMGMQTQALQSQAGNRDQFAVDLATRRANYLEKAQDTLQALNEGRLDVLQDDPMQILAQRNTLADQRFGQESARFGMGMDYEQMSSDDALRKAIADLIKGDLGGGGRPGGGGGPGPGPGPGGGGPYDPKDRNPSSGGGSTTGDPKGGGGRRRSTQQLIDRRGQLDDRVERIAQDLYGNALNTDAHNWFQRTGPGEWNVNVGPSGSGMEQDWAPIEDERLLRSLKRRRKVAKKIRRRGVKAGRKAGGAE